ncbi:ORF MSV248 putative inhibitor of apoptosis protein (IAP), similar to Orgyia pseudotsugata NPV GB:U75930 [Melanoplus sanguinipes entomopoxvirus]|uniref:ORF MSV248 putative inhibitor of apoptosis protein (IAP), similar to Orgyia pseudotsugata NPV GB:U75930 n=1 Tax=Melanoplus sanguinipes entomopoxvirus TaxID=83191 RepID=Q9YVJ4_MSEPV|nr:ORF MSV248 putative inhibitor of apoptosis protein (IAP), similar to Orgyia pseudotsugata NPV GB:U75930 [Melanoplus sanguinipes entomopoxvirus]AAC97724.1 ORF MSV248 putative inhibitor of apoptosis protein (IAP), similar to Orgyia pseudotsugata NPV GB:U75930 [Melanoplus sanguinipes entomopoxvirus 'O']
MVDNFCTPLYPYYITLQSRINSYENWPISLFFKINRLCEAGFFYTNIGDITVCFNCGLKIKNWLYYNDPWIEHSKWSPNCNYIIFNKGKKFINFAKNFKHQLLYNCIICNENNISYILKPCGHASTCYECSYKIYKCPVCYNTISTIIRY